MHILHWYILLKLARQRPPVFLVRYNDMIDSYSTCVEDTELAHFLPNMANCVQRIQIMFCSLTRSNQLTCILLSDDMPKMH